ncbi:MAG: hypothetical protein AB7K09_13850 [Planctomycetota bacterium]
MRAPDCRLLSGAFLVFAWATGCTSASGVPGSGDGEWTHVPPGTPPATIQLLAYHLIQVINDADPQHKPFNVGYVRHERMTVYVKPWDELDANGLVVRLPGSFRQLVPDVQGRARFWEAVDKTIYYVLDMASRPVGLVYEDGSIRKWDPNAVQMVEMVEVGNGNMEEAARLLLDLKDAPIRFQLMDSTMMSTLLEQVGMNRNPHTGVITDISQDVRARVSLQSPEQAAGFRAGDRVCFTEVMDADCARWLASTNVWVVSIDANILTTTLDARRGLSRGHFESGTLRIDVGE